jgi:hypothetical protein
MCHEYRHVDPIRKKNLKSNKSNINKKTKDTVFSWNIITLGIEKHSKCLNIQMLQIRTEFHCNTTFSC